MILSQTIGEFCNIFPKPINVFHGIFPKPIDEFLNFFSTQLPTRRVSRFVPATYYRNLQAFLVFFSCKRWTNFFHMTNWHILWYFLATKWLNLNFSLHIWLTNSGFFSSWQSIKFRITFCERLANLAISSWDWLTKFTMFSHAQLKNFVIIFWDGLVNFERFFRQLFAGSRQNSWFFAPQPIDRFHILPPPQPIGEFWYFFPRPFDKIHNFLSYRRFTYFARKLTKGGTGCIK